MSNEDALATIQDRLSYQFRDLAHLRDALTHRSYVNEQPRHAPRDNERLEYLGDAIFELAASALLFQRYPEAREGELTRRRADMVCERTFAQIGRALGLDEGMRLGRGEEKSGGRDKPRLLASALEAVIAAVYLDSDEREAITAARALLAPHLGAMSPGESDFKSRLQELLQGRKQPRPRYELVGREGPDHDVIFHVRAIAGAGLALGEGRGTSKAIAEQAAAQVALERLAEEEE